MHFYALFIFLVNGGHCAKILGVFLYPSVSHQKIYLKISSELSLRGHQVTVVTPNPLKNPSLTNLTEINVDFAHDVLKRSQVREKFSNEVTPYEILTGLYDLIDMLAEEELNSPQVRSLISDEKQKFDLILIHYFHPVMYGLAARFKAPIISVSTLNVFAINYDCVGNPNHPVLYPEVYFNFRPGKLTFLEKLKSIYFVVRHKFHHDWFFLPNADRMAKKYFGNVPYIDDLEKNVSMLFVYRNILMEPAKPQVPAVLEVSFIDTKAPKPLQDDLQKILDGATEGAIYISFGSNVKTTHFGENLKNSILEALPELPYTVLIKWDSDDFPLNSSKVIVRKWYPQRDLLAHPNIKVFVTQGGLQSIEEAILAEVPLVGVPFLVDQPKNVRYSVELGIGEKLDFANVDKTIFKNTIIKVAENISYKEKIKKVRQILLDKSMSGLESAIWWCEYVIRHKGTKHLKGPALNVSYSEYFLLDLSLFLIFSPLLIFCCLKICWKSYMQRFKKRKNTIKRKNSQICTSRKYSNGHSKFKKSKLFD